MSDLPPIDWAELGIDTRGRTSGQVKVRCPQCSHTRRNHREPCLSVDLDNNVWRCHHCGWSGPEPGFARDRGHVANCRPGYGAHLSRVERERPAKRAYRKPAPPTPAPDQDRMLEFFQRRGISTETVSAFGITQDARSICFPYYRDGNLINIKHRGPEKRFWMEAEAELAFFNLDRVQGEETIYIVEGEMDVLALAEAGITNVISPRGMS